ncbi:12494_t:CDS:2 [Cetraspora pellucida]|uniref:12494_t:CDS:1 n=1 Tax=Cetraspora pellucida TaxID=1433469 RepID=A0A9N8WN66_9GLOM|nr:12494_t:CDS:2 [Cetraspora pellucida]
MPSLDPFILANLQQMLDELNPYYSRHYNTPNASEVTAIMIEDEQKVEPLQCDIVLHLCDSGLQKIFELHHTYQPLYYVLMFPRGEDSWYSYISINYGLFISSVYLSNNNEDIGDDNEENAVVNNAEEAVANTAEEMTSLD